MFALLIGPLGYDKYANMMPGHHLEGYEKVCYKYFHHIYLYYPK
jgi:hypothetical protein